MSFNAVIITGYLIKKHGSLEDYIQLVCKKMTHKETGQQYEKEEMVNVIQNDPDGFFNLDELLDTYHLDFYDDIQYDMTSGKIIYKFNPIFQVGDICCAVMIYLCCVGSNEQTYTFKDEDILQLVAWKNMLVAEGRLPDTTVFACVPNCCS